MNRVLVAPKIKYQCPHCQAKCEATIEAFKPMRADKSMFSLECAHCTIDITGIPEALVHNQTVGSPNRDTTY